jgi:hypothetical protein
MAPYRQSRTKKPGAGNQSCVKLHTNQRFCLRVATSIAHPTALAVMHPIEAPASMSDAQCFSMLIRDQAMVRAAAAPRAVMGDMPRRSASAVATVKTFTAWPEGAARFPCVASQHPGSALSCGRARPVARLTTSPKAPPITRATSDWLEPRASPDLPVLYPAAQSIAKIGMRIQRNPASCNIFTSRGGTSASSATLCRAALSILPTLWRNAGGWAAPA